MPSEVPQDPIVETKLGKVVGRVVETIDKFPYYSFQGMRYAQPPIGNLRFKSPLPATPWEGVWNAKKEGNRSVSFNTEMEIIGDEDCLFINVYTPKLPNETSTLFPVMFYIHGGGFYLGSGNTDLHSPDFLISKNVVIVTFNYRLGALGNIHFRDPRIKAPGNVSYKDMIMALRWVRDNIICFNGDPNNVTLWGQSAGGISAHTVLVSPMAKGLFHKAIIQSGTSFVGFDTPNRSSCHCLDFTRHAGKDFKTEFEAYEYLMNLSKEEITQIFIKIYKWAKTNLEAIVGPRIEHYDCGEERLLEKEPELYYLAKEVNLVPMIVGFNAGDGMVYATKEYCDGYILPNFTDPRLVVPLELGIPRDSDKCLEIGEKITKFYYQGEAPSRRNMDKYSKYQTDVRYNMRTKRIVQLHQYAANHPVYVYRFDLDSPLNLYKKILQVKMPGVCHSDEMTYIFKTKYPLRIRPGSVEERTQHRLITLWTNFAKTGDPNPVEKDPFINAVWTPATDGRINHLHIGKVLSMKDSGPDAPSMAFWDEIYKSHLKEKCLAILGKEVDLDMDRNIANFIKLLKWELLPDEEKKKLL